MGSNIYHVLGFLEPYWLLEEAKILAVTSKQILSARLFAVCSTILFSSIICLIFNLPFLDRSDFGRGGSRENNGSSDLGSKTNSGAKKVAIVIYPGFPPFSINGNGDRSKSFEGKDFRFVGIMVHLLNGRNGFSSISLARSDRKV